MLFQNLFIFCWTVTVLQAIRIGPIINDVLRKEIYGPDYIDNIIQQDGYQIESHDVTTKDGYILRLNRVLSNNSKNICKSDLPPVYLLHGLASSAESWLVSGKGRVLSYLLSDAGYDVWLGNARGSTHSRRHKHLKPVDSKFWDFSWHEIGIYDNAANIDYILKRTKQKQLHYIGHSQGTTTFFVLMSMLPEYNKKIKTMHALAPVAFVKHGTSPYTLVSFFIPELILFSKAFGLEEFFPRSFLVSIIERFCKSEDPFLNLCFQLLAIAGGSNPKQMDVDALLKIFKYIPSGTSVYQIVHYGQLHLNGKFQSYDYGKNGNLKHYNQKTPIDYPLEKITAKSVNLYVGRNDILATVKDIETLISKLPIKPNYIEIADKEWNHFDYLIAKDVKELVYDTVLGIIKNADNIICGANITRV